MNALNIVPLNQTMSSREIAELTGKRHDNVMRTIRDLIADQILTPQIEESTFEHVGNSYKQFLLNKRDSLVVVARLSPEFTAAVIDRWQELELQAREPSRLQLAQWFIESETKLIETQNQLAITTPKAIALDRIADTKSLFTIREAAKTIKIKERDLVSLLLNRGWAFRDARSVMQPYAEKIATGYVTSIMTKPITGNDGQDRVFSQLRITAKGVTRLGYLAAKELAA